MNIENELTKRLNEWLYSRRQMVDWMARHDGGDPALEAEQFTELRDRCYDCEWSLLSLGARMEAWEKALEGESDEDCEEALELRSMVAELEVFSKEQVAKRGGTTLAGWWFIPYAAWVGHPRPTAWSHPDDHARPMIERVVKMFQVAAQTYIPEQISGEVQAVGKAMPPSTFLFYPSLDADKLRDFMVPPGPEDEWPASERGRLEFTANPDSPLRAGCVGIYLAAVSYKTLALIRDMVRGMLEVVAEENDEPDLYIGPMLPKRLAIQEADIMRWGLWAKHMLDAPLQKEALSRHVSLVVKRKGDDVQSIHATVADLDGNKVLETQEFECRLESSQMLMRTISPFALHASSKVSWSVQNLEV